jgi:hypothetical protein
MLDFLGGPLSSQGVFAKGTGRESQVAQEGLSPPWLGEGGG